MYLQLYRTGELKAKVSQAVASLASCQMCPRRCNEDRLAGKGGICKTGRFALVSRLVHLRAMFPKVPFVGMEPAVKPAAQTTRTGRVGVMATPATFQGALYASEIERFAQGVTVLQHTCPGLVAQIEAGDLASQTTRAILEDALLPMLAQGIDTVVLGCTHYPFAIPLIEEICGSGVRVIDPAPAVARQVERLLSERNLRSVMQRGGELRIITTGKLAPLAGMLPALLGESCPVEQVRWAGRSPTARSGP